MYLEDCEHGLADGVKVTPGVGRVPELAAEDLHAEQRENEYEEEEDNEERRNGRDRVDQRLDQVPHRRPVSATDKVGFDLRGHLEVTMASEAIKLVRHGGLWFTIMVYGSFLKRWCNAFCHLEMLKSGLVRGGINAITFAEYASTLRFTRARSRSGDFFVAFALPTWSL